MPRTPLRYLRPELFEDECETDSDVNDNDFDESTGQNLFWARTISAVRKHGLYSNGTHNWLSRQKMPKFRTFQESVQFLCLHFGG